MERGNREGKGLSEQKWVCDSRYRRFVAVSKLVDRRTEAEKKRRLLGITIWCPVRDQEEIPGFFLGRNTTRN